MTRSENIDQLAAALAVAQGKIEGAAKDSANPFFKSKYADLASVWDAIREPLSSNGLAVLQLPMAEGPRVTITTLLTHSSGQWVSSDLTVTAKEDAPQAVGSAITYARRYALQSVAGVAPEDDDGEGAQGRPRPDSSGKWAKGPTPAQQAVADRRIEELKAQRAPNADELKHYPGCDPERRVDAQPSTLDEVLATFGKLSQITTAFAQLKTHFLKVLDQEVWDQILLEHKCDGVKTFPSIGAARKCFTALWRETEKATVPPANGTYHATSEGVSF